MLNVQNINQTISFLLVGLRASQLHGFSLNEHLSGTTTLVHARNNNVRVNYINNGEGIEIDTNQGSTTKFMRYIITLTFEITNYTLIKNLPNNFINVFRRIS